MVMQEESKVREMSDIDGRRGGSMDWVPSTSCRLETESLPRLRFHVNLSNAKYTISWRHLQKLVPPEMCPSSKSAALEARLDALPVPETKKGGGYLMQDAIERAMRMYQGVSDDEGDEGERRRRSTVQREEAVDEDGKGSDADDESDEESGRGKRVERYDTDDPFIDDEELDDYFERETLRNKYKGFFINRGELATEDEDPRIKKMRKRKRTRNGEQEEGSPKKKARGKANTQTSRKKQNVKQKDVQTAGKSAETRPAKNDAEGVVKSTLSAKKKRPIQGVIKPKSFTRRKKKPAEPGTSTVPNENMEPVAVKDHLTETSVDKVSSRSMAEAAASERQREPSEDNVSSENTSSPDNVSSGHMEAEAAKEPLTERSNGMEVDGGPAAAKPESEERSGSRKVSNPKVSALDKAVQDLEKEVMQRCPRTSDTGSHDDVQELPAEVKRKLAKVARLAERQKKLTDEFYDGLMAFLGHMTGLDNLKHDMQEMVEFAQTAEAEKQTKLDNMKLELMDMITARLPQKHSAGATQFTWDAELEDRLCDLYEVHVMGVFEHKGAPTKKFYAQLVGLWPEGITDSDSVRAAVTRAKERRKDALRQAKIEEKKRKVTSRVPAKRGKKEKGNPSPENDAGKPSDAVEAEESN